MRQYKRSPLTMEEQQKLENACQSFKEKLVVWFLLDTGLRLSEFVNLKKEDIQWQERRIKVYGKGGPFGKGSKLRVIPLTNRAFQLLESAFVMENSIKSLKLSKRNVAFVLQRVANRAMITKKISPHVLRHTFAVSCIRKGMPTRVVQELLGHDHIETTEIYLNLSPDDVDKVFREKW